MTRDEAINGVLACYVRAAGTDTMWTLSSLRRSAEGEVDALVAIGVLKLDEDRLDSVPVTASLESLDEWAARTTAMPEAGSLRYPGKPQDRCEPPPEHRIKEWHWLVKEGALHCAMRLEHGRWLVHGMAHTDAGAHQSGWRYVAPCEEPQAKKRRYVKTRQPVMVGRFPYPAGSICEVISTDGLVANVRFPGKHGTTPIAEFVLADVEIR